MLPKSENLSLHHSTKFNRFLVSTFYSVIVRTYRHTLADYSTKTVPCYAILEFYFQFRFWSHYGRRYLILHWHIPNFMQIMQPTADLIRHIGFQDGVNAVANLFPVSSLSTPLI